MTEMLPTLAIVAIVAAFAAMAVLAVVLWRGRNPSDPQASAMSDLAQAQSATAARLEAMIRMLGDRQSQLQTAVNERLRLVEQLWAHKRDRGYDMEDPTREARMLHDLRSANEGPLSDDGVRSLLNAILDLTRREALVGLTPAECEEYENVVQGIRGAYIELAKVRSGT